MSARTKTVGLRLQWVNAGVLGLHELTANTWWAIYKDDNTDGLFSLVYWGSELQRLALRRAVGDVADADHG